ncbi:phosphatidylinositol 4-kinase gamma 4-like [Salvia miltiorrhiza]|uniref:phosphatidylinositol 4-kinase gamma 4-like n=1 Tax=Salvia miltiorrhiza TaxID=226208 RepID=UPI0025AC4930|nr:phosphatidylinositol 4-kinase gamma 4-like [Salvia miltiorrhiza]
MSAVDIAMSPILDGTTQYAGCFKDRLDLCSSESIKIYITVGGSSTPMRMMESDSIASVKLRIQECKGFVVKSQKLVFGGRELSRTNSLVKDYGIGDGNALHLALRVSDILMINVRTACGEEFEFQVDKHRNVGYLKRRIAKKGKGFHDVHPEIFCHGVKLQDDDRLIGDLSNSSDAVLHLVVHKYAEVWSKTVERDVELSITSPDSNNRMEGICEEKSKGRSILSRTLLGQDFFLKPVIVSPSVEFPHFLWKMAQSVSDGLALGRQPVRSSEGTGGTYFMQDATGDKYVAIFKPIDEEPLALNNPQGLPPSLDGIGLKRGTRVGEGAWREVAAYILDHPCEGSPQSLFRAEVGFAGVPPTMMVHCLHKGFNHPNGFYCSSEQVKTGSLQMFRKNHGSCEDMGPRDFPVDEVHKICVLDIRVANADRHAGNILLHKDPGNGRITLTPIDHGYCLPENFEDCTFEWLYWPQARQPFSRKTLDYIKSLDAEKDIAVLQFYGLDLSPEVARTLRVSTMLLKKGAERGLTAFAIGSIMCRENLNKKSVIEKIVQEAKDTVLPGMSEAVFLETVSEVMDSTLDKLL